MYVIIASYKNLRHGLRKHENTHTYKSDLAKLILHLIAKTGSIQVLNGFVLGKKHKVGPSYVEKIVYIWKLLQKDQM